jgi:putative membrane protein
MHSNQLIQGFVVWLLNAAALLVTSYIMPGMAMNGFGTALVAALILSLVNFLILPILAFLTLPVTILTFGLFGFVLMGLMLKLTSKLMPGFHIVGWLPAFVGAIVLVLVQALFRFAFHTLV